MFRIKVRLDGRWVMVARGLDAVDAIDVYNDAPTPRMLIGPKGIVHKQYSNNGFVYSGGPGLLR